MGFDEQLAGRVRTALGGRRELVEERVFGGLAFMHRGHMACVVLDDEIMVHVPPDDYEDALALEGARPATFDGRPLKGMLSVGKEGIRTRHRLERWVRNSLAVVATLADKRKKPLAG
jgi:hypothetical protein